MNLPTWALFHNWRRNQILVIFPTYCAFMCLWSQHYLCLLKNVNTQLRNFRQWEPGRFLFYWLSTVVRIWGGNMRGRGGECPDYPLKMPTSHRLWLVWRVLSPPDQGSNLLQRFSNNRTRHPGGSRNVSRGLRYGRKVKKLASLLDWRHSFQKLFLCYFL